MNEKNLNLIFILNSELITSPLVTNESLYPEDRVSLIENQSGESDVSDDEHGLVS